MNSKFAISTTFLGDNLPLSEVLPACINLGFKSIELGSNHKYESDIGFVKQYKVNYLVHNYFPTPKNSFVVNIASLDDDIRKKSVSHIKGSILYCEEIGAEIYTFHPGFVGDPSTPVEHARSYDFNWNQESILRVDKNKSADNMYVSLDEICKFCQGKNVKIAIETEGSYSNAARLHMQAPIEYENFFKNYSKNDIQINLNIGHLYLSSRFNKFSIDDFLTQIHERVIALELSHNNGLEDEHLPLVEDAWYWPIIFDDRFNSSYKILEFRNVSENMVKKSINLLNKYEKR
jgi:sugar phosphate isomerase/epimerase